MFAAGDLEKLEECGKRLLTLETIADLFGLDRKKVRQYMEQDNEASKR